MKQIYIIAINDIKTSKLKGEMFLLAESPKQAQEVYVKLMENDNPEFIIPKHLVIRRFAEGPSASILPYVQEAAKKLYVPSMFNEKKYVLRDDSTFLMNMLTYAPDNKLFYIVPAGIGGTYSIKDSIVSKIQEIFTFNYRTMSIHVMPSMSLSENNKDTISNKIDIETIKKFGEKSNIIFMIDNRYNIDSVLNIIDEIIAIEDKIFSSHILVYTEIMVYQVIKLGNGFGFAPSIPNI